MTSECMTIVLCLMDVLGNDTEWETFQERKQFSSGPCSFHCPWTIHVSDALSSYNILFLTVTVGEVEGPHYDIVLSACIFHNKRNVQIKNKGREIGRNTIS